MLEPSLNSQVRVVTVPVEVSVKVTAKGTWPLVGLKEAVKLATGATRGAFTVMVREVVLLPPGPVAVRVMV